MKLTSSSRWFESGSKEFFFQSFLTKPTAFVFHFQKYYILVYITVFICSLTFLQIRLLLSTENCLRTIECSGGGKERRESLDFEISSEQPFLRKPRQ